MVGIGVNVMTSPEEGVLYPTADVAGRLRPMTLAKRILLQYNTLLDLLDKKGFKEIRKRWLEYATGLHKNISIHLADMELKGIFKGIDAKGALLLKQKSGTRTLNVGDVFFNKDK